MQRLFDSLALVGRIGLASLFVLAGINKLMQYAPTATRMQEAGLEPVGLLLPMVIALELGGGLLVARGRRFVVPAALALALFTLATNLLFHRFWDLDGSMRVLELSLFFKNVAITGALVMLAGMNAPQVEALVPPHQPERRIG